MRLGYAGIDHPAVAQVICYTCQARAGVPCRPREMKGHGPYTETHRARIRSWERLCADRARERRHHKKLSRRARKVHLLRGSD